MRKILLVLIFCSVFIIKADDEPASGYDLISVHNANQIVEINRFGEGSFTSGGSWSPDGELFALPASLGIWLFDIKNFQNPELLVQSIAVRNVAWSSDGMMFAWATDDSTTIWDVDSHSQLNVYDSAIKVVFSPDGEYLVLTKAVNFGNTGLDTSPIFEVINIASGEIVGRIAGTGYSSGRAFFSSDGNYLLTQSLCYLPQYCEYDSLFQIWDINEPFPMAPSDNEFEPTNDANTVFGRSPVELTNNRIAYIGYDEDTQWMAILDLETHEERRVSTAGSPYSQLIPHPSELIESLNNDAGHKEFHFIDPVSGEITRSLDVGTFLFYDFSPDSQFLIGSATNQVSLYTLTDANLSEISTYNLQFPNVSEIPETLTSVDDLGFIRIQLEETEPPSRCGAFNSDNSQFVGRSDFGDVYLWDAETRHGELLSEVEPNDNAGDFVFNSDSTMLAFEISDCLMNGRCTSSIIYGYSLVEDQTLAFAIPSEVVSQMVFGQNEASNLLVVVTDNAVSLINADNGTTVSTLPQSSSPVSRIAFSADGRYLISRHIDNTIRVWGVPSENS